METADGKFHYDLSKDTNDGALFSRTAISSEPNGLEDNPVTLNIEFADGAINGERMTAQLRAQIEAAAQAELERVGIARQISAKAVGARNSGPSGTYQGGIVRLLRTAGEWLHTVDHEIIHALRDPKQWAGEFGLFSATEWRALVKAARADEAIRNSVDYAYADWGTTAHSEEVVAEFYVDWARISATRRLARWGLP